MGKSDLADIFWETESYIEYKREEIKRTNYETMCQISRALGVVYLVVLGFLWMFFDDVKILPIEIIAAVVLLLLNKPLKMLENCVLVSFRTMRLTVYIVYGYAAVIAMVFDHTVHGQGNTLLGVCAMMLVALLYEDGIGGYVCLEAELFLCYVVISIACHRPGRLLMEDLIFYLAAMLLSMYAFWMRLRRHVLKSREERMIKEEGSKDLLTGLLNKISFEREAGKYLTKSRKTGHGALLIIDFDNFKMVNDSFGHLTGDAILKRFGEILMRTFGEADIIGRVGGDEFMVLMTGEVSEELIQRKCDGVEHELYVSRVGDAGAFSCSIGVAVNLGGYDFKNLYRLADDALYEAKARGKACYIIRTVTAIVVPDKPIVYIASQDDIVRGKIKETLGEKYQFMETTSAATALNEISLYEDYIESVFMDYSLPDISKAVIRKYINSRPAFARIPVHDVEKEL